MGKWSKVGEAKASGDSLPNLLMGEPIGTRAECVVRITNIKDVDGRSGDLFFIIEFEVLETSNDAILKGRQYSQVIKYNQDMGPVNVKRFILAVNGLDPNDPDNEEAFSEDEIEDAIDGAISEGLLNGTEMPLSVEVVETKKKKEPFTKHTWHPTEGAEGSDPKDMH